MEITKKICDQLSEDGRMIRDKVFCQEQGYVYEFEELDEQPGAAVHLVLYCDGVPAGTARMVDVSRSEGNQPAGQFKVGRVAVLPEYRQFHLGNRLLEEMENIALEQGGVKLEVSAQVQAKGFYEKNGFVACGTTYMDEFCPHITMYKRINRHFMKTAWDMLTFIQKSPTSFHAVETVKFMLNAAGFEELRECDTWSLEPLGRYYVTRNQSSLVAFQIPQGTYSGFQIIASHSDSPSFQVKENGELKVEDKYVKLNVEKYGGMLCATWFDRPLSVAGRVMVRTQTGVEARLINIDQDLLMLPSLAIHMNRKANEGVPYNIQNDMLPVYGDGTAAGTFQQMLATAAGVKQEEILGTDLMLYNRSNSTIWGAEEAFASSPRLDDLQCAYASLKGFLAAMDAKEQTPVSAAKKQTSVSMACYCLYDNEEVGSGTKQGARSTFLKDTLQRINVLQGGGEEQMMKVLANSFLLSADNAHAVHPNNADKTDVSNRPAMNGGIVIKRSANQKYTTDAVSESIVKLLCERAGVPYQVFVNRSDMEGGSTLGNLSAEQLAVNSADIGLAQLAMHSAYETCGVRDTQYLVELAKEFYETTLLMDGAQYQLIRAE